MADGATLDRIARVRAFNRAYTSAMGLLRGGYLNSPYNVTEARVVYELAQGGSMELRELRRRLNLDAGYLSRVLSRLQEEGLLVKERSDEDGRRRLLQLTDAGRSTFAMLNERSAREIAAVLAPLGDEAQGRLLAAMDSITALLADTARPQAYVLRMPRPGDLGWVVQRHGQIYAEEFGWDTTFEALVARIVADYVDHHDPKRESAWIAEVDGEPVGSVFCVKKSDDVAKLRLLLVDPAARGLGIGSRLVEECERFARLCGYRELELWTNDVLTAARRIYDAAGFTLRSEERHHSFGHDLVGQVLRKDL